MQHSSVKQKLLVEYLVSSSDTFALCKAILQPSYFDVGMRNVVEFVHNYYDQYHNTPSVDVIEADTGVVLTAREVSRDEIQYCAEEIEVFCRHKAMEAAVRSAPALMAAGQYSEVETAVKNALLVSLNKDMGLSYFENVHDRLENQSLQPLRVTSKWPLIDDALGGGFARKELVLVSANSGGGKSITLANIAINLAEQGLKVLYVSLELAEEVIAQRLDMMFTGIPTFMSSKEHAKIADQVAAIAPTMGSFFIKRFPSGTNANTLRAYLKEFELKNKYLPDVLVVDYLDIMGANEHVSADNVSEKDKRAAEQLRDILFDFDMMGFSASQQNRSAIDAPALNQSHIAGGLTKVNTVDVYVSVILTPAMKASGEIGFAFLKTRNSEGVGQTIYLKWDNKRLRIVNPDGSTVPEISPNKPKAKISLASLLSEE